MVGGGSTTRLGTGVLWGLVVLAVVAAAGSTPEGRM